MDLESCSQALSQGFNKIYSWQFMLTLNKKARFIQDKFPNSKISNVKTKNLKTFLDFDGAVTAPLHGFTDAKDYWKRSSSLQFLKSIKVPTLIVNALNDPFLGPSCYPDPIDISNTMLTFEYPNYGGHVGFVDTTLSGFNYMDKRAKSFILSVSST